MHVVTGSALPIARLAAVPTVAITSAIQGTCRCFSRVQSMRFSLFDYRRDGNIEPVVTVLGGTMPFARTLAWLFAAPTAAVVVGIGVLHRHGLASARLALMAGALVVAMLVAVLIARAGRRRIESAAPALATFAITLLAFTFVGPGQDGVHRWLALGPVRVHASAIASPMVLAAALGLVAHGRGAWAAIAIAIAQAIHAVQPDAAQSTALGLGVIVGLARWPMPMRTRIVAIGMTAASVVPAWCVADPLAPVAEVEGVVALAAELGRPMQIVAVVVLGLVPVSLAVVTSRGARAAIDRATCSGLVAYVVGIMVAPMFGDFPVPLLGFGTSPVLGLGVCIGCIAAFVVARHDKRGPGP